MNLLRSRIATACAALALAAAALPAAAQKNNDRRDPAAVEAAAARAESRRGVLDNGESPAQLRANALARCQVHKGENHADCEALVRGEGSQTGSVQGGGVLREKTTRSVGAPPGAASTPGN